MKHVKKKKEKKHFPPQTFSQFYSNTQWRVAGEKKKKNPKQKIPLERTSSDIDKLKIAIWNREIKKIVILVKQKKNT